MRPISPSCRSYCGSRNQIRGIDSSARRADPRSKPCGQRGMSPPGRLEFALDQCHPGLKLLPFEGECPSEMADRGLFVGGNHEATTCYSFNGGTDSYCTSIAHKFGSGLAFARPRMARGGGRGSGSRWRDRCAVILRRLRLRLPGLRLRLWDRVQLSGIRLWHRLQLSGLHGRIASCGHANISPNLRSQN